MVKEAAANGDPVAQHIKQLKLEINHISLYLTDPYAESSGSEETKDKNDDDDEDDNKLRPMVVDIDLELSAFANARRYITIFLIWC